MRGHRSAAGVRLAATTAAVALVAVACVGDVAVPAPGTPLGAAVDAGADAAATATDAAADTAVEAVPAVAGPGRADGPGTPRVRATPSPQPDERTPADDSSPPPAWFGTRSLPVTATGYPAPQPVPDGYEDRRLWTSAAFPPPPDDAFVWEQGPVPADVLARSTWTPSCPVTVDELRYVTLSFWGFDGLHHTGELVAHRDAVDVLRAAFAVMHEQRFPLEGVRVASRPPDPPVFRGDDNTTTVFDCRPITGSGGWSQHAYGLAIDINPFHNPYRRERDGGTVVLPAYASAYLDRDDVRPGMLSEGDPVVAVFDAAGWGWGGRWRSLDDWQHFSASGT